MYYSDTNQVLSNIASYLSERYGEDFKMDRDGKHDRYATYQSKNYFFKVMTAFIQARVNEDFNQPINERLDSVLSGIKIQPREEYLLTSRLVERSSPHEIPVEYCISLQSAG
ncbi:hypothetical protein [Microbulbifer sp. TRSA007]|uniref:hypothetical protein n=1 Tax=unclassified Microbulbifer TaxID=2619833 RepID=UPI004039270C